MHPEMSGISSPATVQGATRPLDLIIIGAQKSGTTTLFKYLSVHPDLYMLPEKEAPFFSRDTYHTHGWKWFVSEYFADAPPGKLWGKATPQYMCDPGVPDRILDTLPHVKLIAILRHPLERAASHYKMMYRRGLIKESFESLMLRLLDPQQAMHARTLPAGPDHEPYCALVWGEYGRILAQYYERFGREQIFVCFLEELSQNPAELYKQICRFLDVDATFVPTNLGQQYHIGGARQFIPGARRLLKGSPLHSLWKKVPRKHRNYLNYWFDQLNTRRGSTAKKADTNLTEETTLKVLAYFREDIQRLEDLIQRSLPWGHLHD